MRAAAKIPLLVLLTVLAALSADSPEDALFGRLRGKTLVDVRRAPRYTCIETVSRARYRPRNAPRTNDCRALIAARDRPGSRGQLIWRDRIRIEVALAEHSEVFSWPGAGRFETSDLDDLIPSGSSGSGEFATFLTNVFGGAAEQFHYLGEQDTPLGRLAAFTFVVPTLKSNYSYRSRSGGRQHVGYHGIIYADAAGAELKRLVVNADELNSSEVCRVADTMDYTRLKTASGDFLLPSLSTMNVLFAVGDETVNETQYSGCREFTGQSTIRFDDAEPGAASEGAKAALREIPKGTRIQVKIDPPLNGATAAAGDAIIGVVERTVRHKGRAVVRASDRLHGRVLRLEQTIYPPRWTVAIRFDTIEHDGLEQSISLQPVDDGDRTGTRLPRSLARETEEPPAVPLRPPGGGVFIFSGGSLTLGSHFHSEWETK